MTLVRLPDLPVRRSLDALAGALADVGAAVLVAPPGAGKTTLVPLALLDAPSRGGRIVVLEPRRLAARAAATRMATLLGEADVGETVGYRMRLDTRVGPRTRIEVVTEGVLTRMLQSDPSLEGIDLVVFDEFHERSLAADLGLALCLHARQLLRPDLRLLVMSATLDAEPVAALLGDPPVIRASGHQHAVDTHLRDIAVEGPVEAATAAAIMRALEVDEGDVLAFLPGAGEIRRTLRRLEDRSPGPDVDVMPLFGNLPRREQDRAIAPSPAGRRKVVLSTSIAETSLTIEGIRVVVDSGLMRVPRFDPGSGMERLETLRVTRDVADQRRGRAGRTAPGVCYRLWTAGQDREILPHRRAEILDADLTPLALELAAWGASPDELAWLDPPPAAATARARELLRELQALDAGGAITEHGRRLVALGHHPRLAHMIARGRERGLGPLACDVAALLSGRDVLRGEGRAPDADLRLRLEALRRAREGERRPDLAGGHAVAASALRHALREARRWRRRAGLPPDVESSAESLHETGLLVALAYPDRVGMRREGSRGRFLLRSGRGARFLEPQSLADADWLVAVEVQGGGPEARVFQAAPVTRQEVEEVFAEQIAEQERIEWDAASARVRAWRERRLGALVLSRAPLHDADDGAVRATLLSAIRDVGLGVLPWNRRTERLRERLQFLHLADPRTWPDVSDEALLADLEGWLGPFLAGIRRPADIGDDRLGEALLGRAGWKLRPRLDELAPTHVEVPSGARVPIDYADPEAPALAVRVQQVFGWAETPRIAGGRVPLTLRLLSPAQRPVQVTTDLASFWRDAYYEVKKDLAGRYPKHAWPEDPLHAEPTDRARRDR